MKSNIRTKTYYCGKKNGKTEYLEIDLFPMLEVDKPKSRKAKTKLTCPKQKNLNNKIAKRYFQLLVKSNFGENDIHVTLTYADAFLPATIEEAEREVKNYLRRLARRRKQLGLSPLKYIYVSEQSQTGRIHHHLVINGGLDRDEIEKLWRKKMLGKAGQLGHANADRLRISGQGLDALASYLSKDPKGRKRWVPSRNLTKPELSVSDSKTSKAKFRQLSLLPPDCEAVREHFEKQHPGYKLTEFVKSYNEITASWMMRAKMTLKERGGDNAARKVHETYKPSL